MIFSLYICGIVTVLEIAFLNNGYLLSCFASIVVSQTKSCDAFLIFQMAMFYSCRRAFIDLRSIIASFIQRKRNFPGYGHFHYFIHNRFIGCDAITTPEVIKIAFNHNSFFFINFSLYNVQHTRLYFIMLKELPVKAYQLNLNEN